LRGFKHKDFARFVRIANGSLGEVLNHLIDAHDQRLISAKELEKTSRLAKRGIKASAGLIRFLESTPDPEPPRYKPPTEDGGT
jgi:four helix bundle protein